MLSNTCKYALRALIYLGKFSEEENYFYWIILFMKADPLLDGIVDMPEFERLYNKIETRFWKNHRTIRQSLEKKDLI